MTNTFKHSINFIYWKREATRKYIKINEMNNLIDMLNNKGHKVTESKTDRSYWLQKLSYRIDTKGYYNHIYVYEKPGVYIEYICNYIDDSKNKPLEERDHNGYIAYKAENDLFKKYNGISERAAFGYCDRKLIYKCVPKQLYYINENYIGRNMTGVSKADFSSHYPANQKGRMPDWREHLVLEGTVPPNEKYPFAFYIGSGHSAEYGVYDTHNWLTEKLAPRLFGERFTYVSADKDTTILCKASKYTYDKVIDELYEAKSSGKLVNDVPAKVILNSAIGWKHRKEIECKACMLDHIATVVIARANQEMINLYNENSNNILQIIVDGIIYKGKYKLGIDEKQLGKLHQELTDCEFRMRGTNQYIFMKNGEFVDWGHSGFNDNLETNCLEDIEKWSKSV